MKLHRNQSRSCVPNAWAEPIPTVRYKPCAVSLDVSEHEFVAVVGPSGCGKSTLLNLLGGLDTPSEGEVYFRGKPLSRIDRDQYRAHDIGFVFQSFHLLATLSALENVQVPMFETSWNRRERARRALRLIEQVGLAHRRNHRPMSLSVGERQRVAIARAAGERAFLAPGRRAHGQPRQPEPA